SRREHEILDWRGSPSSRSLSAHGRRGTFSSSLAYAPSSHCTRSPTQGLYRIALVEAPFPAQSYDRRAQNHPPFFFWPDLLTLKVMFFALFFLVSLGNLSSQKICRLSCSVPSLGIYALAHIVKGIKSFT